MRFALFPIAAMLAFAGEYTTYIGDQYPRYVTSMTADAAGNTYIVGNRTSGGGPTSLEIFPANAKIGLAEYYNPYPDDVFITKLDPSGNILFTKFFVGEAASVAVDPSGNIYVAGFTTSIDFPLSNALQTQAARYEAGFIVKLTGDGKTILYSTYFGGVTGDTAIQAIATDAAGNLYLTGSTTSSDFPHTTGLPLATVDPQTPAAFVASISAAGDKVLFAGTMGKGNCAGGPCAPDYASISGYAIALDGAGNVYFGGNAYDPLPTTAGALMPKGSGAFIGKVAAGGAGLAYLTFLDSPTVSLTVLYSLAVDAAGNAYLTGSTSNPKFPATAGALQTNLAGDTNAFVAKLRPDGSALAWATYLGGAGTDVAEWIAVDAAGNAWVCGTTTSPTFPTAQGWSQGGDFLVEINPTGTALTYSARYPFGAVDQAVALDKSLLIHTAGFSGIVSTIRSTGPPAPKMFGIANAAAGGLGGRIAPAEVISIFGPGIGPAAAAAVAPVAGFYPTTFDGVQVTIDGVHMPLLYVSANQINAVVPMGLTPGAASSVRVTNGKAASPDYPLWIDASAGQAFAPVLNQNGTINSQANPAKSGTAVTFFGTGWQSNFAPLADGQVATAAQDACMGTCGLVVNSSFVVSWADLLYAGTSPGIVAGVTQFNLLLGGFKDATGPFTVNASISGPQGVLTQTIWVAP